MSLSSLRPLWLGAALVLALALPAVPARAQVPEPAIDLELVSQPAWHRPGTPLDLELMLTNRTSEVVGGFIVQITAHARSETRSDLELAFDGVTGYATGLITDTETLGGAELTPGMSETITVDEPIDALAALASSPEGGVFPLTVSLLDADGAFLSSLTTAIVYYPEPPETRLNVVLVAPLNELPARRADGSFPAASDPRSLETALGRGGWLRGMVEAIERWSAPQPIPDPHPPRRRGGRGAQDERRAPETEPGLHLGLAPTPRLLEEIADMANGYRRGDPGNPEKIARDAGPARAAARVLDGLRELAGRSGVHPLLVPYALVDLPTLSEHSPERVLQQLSEAERVVDATLGASPGTRWLFPPGGRLDEGTLERLQAPFLGAATRSFFAHESIEQPPDLTSAGCPAEFGSFNCPVRVETFEGTTVGYVADPGVQTRVAELAREGGSALDLQNLIAETAMIREEAPGYEDRVLQITLPGHWHPSPQLAHRLFAAFTGAPWLQTWSPREGLDRGPEPETRRIVDLVHDVPGAPDDAYFEAIERAEDKIDSFSDMIGDTSRASPQSALLERLRRDILVAESRSWWGDEELTRQGLSYALDAEREAQNALDQVTIQGAGEQTFTSRRGRIQLLLFNDGPFPVKVRVYLESPRLTIEQGYLDIEIPAQSISQQRIEAIAETSGTFPVTVRVETPGGNGIEVASKDILIRSTELNRVALGLTVGALLFLILFYALRAMGGRGKGPQPEQAPA
ncbi:MAG: DUF6049 family protein [Actinomycetota bacterium]